MARRTAANRESVPPTLTPQRALELLRQQLGQTDQIQKLRYHDSEVKKWELTTQNILHGTFGKPDGQMHENTKEFAHAYGGPLHFNMSDGELQRNRSEEHTSELQSPCNL